MAETKFLLFREVKDTGKTKVYHILSARDEAMLGYIAWYWPWRRYVFSAADSNTVFDVTCLVEVTTFISTLMIERKVPQHNRLEA